MFINITAVIIGYLLGSIPFAYIAGRLKGIDIRQVGAGNVGALNAMREIGLKAGLAVLVADIGKGLLTIFIASWLGISLIWVFAAGFATVIGHSWSIFLGFHGGKGAATAMGTLLALAPREFAISFALMAVALVITNNVRLCVAVGLASLPLILWRFNQPLPIIAYSIALLIFLLIRLLTSLDRNSLGTKEGLIFDRKYHFWQAKKRS